MPAFDAIKRKPDRRRAGRRTAHVETLLGASAAWSTGEGYDTASPRSSTVPTCINGVYAVAPVESNPEFLVIELEHPCPTEPSTISCDCCSSLENHTAGSQQALDRRCLACLWEFHRTRRVRE